MTKHLKRLALIGIATAALAAPAYADTVTLSFWHNHPEWKDKIQPILDKFEAENPDIKIQLTEIPGPSYLAKMNTALTAGEAPDIIELQPGQQMEAAADSGYIADLTGKVDTAALTPSGLNAATIDGKIWAVPAFGEYTVGLYYNKDIFAANNLTPPKTSGELMALCKTLKAKGITPMIAPSQDGTIPSFLYSLIGSSVLKPQGLDEVRTGKRKFTDPDLVKIGAFLQQLYPCFEDGAIGTGYVEGKALFALGKGAMMEGGSSDYAGFTETNPKINLGVVPFPALPGGTPSTVTGMEGMFAVNSQSPAANQAAAEKFLDWLMGQEGSQMLTDAVTLPTNKNVVPSKNEVLREMVEASKSNDVRVWYEFAELSDAFTAAGNNSQQLFLNEMTPEQYSAAVQAAVKASGGQ
jgi:raffinose/stachyose/melibiose transport system substrate-binding protein